MAVRLHALFSLCILLKSIQSISNQEITYKVLLRDIPTSFARQQFGNVYVATSHGSETCKSLFSQTNVGNIDFKVYCFTLTYDGDRSSVLLIEAQDGYGTPMCSSTVHVKNLIADGSAIGELWKKGTDDLYCGRVHVVVEPQVTHN